MHRAFANYVHVPGVIGIRTNIKGFRWGYGKCVSPSSDSSFNECKIKVFLEEKKDQNVFDGLDIDTYTEVFRDFKAKPQAVSVIYEKKVGAVKLRLSVSIQGDCVRVTVGRSYLKNIRIKLMYIHPVSYMLFDIVSMLLLRRGMTTLYCSAAELHNGSAVLCVAPPNTGKSLTVLQLMNRYGARIIAEDMAVTDGTSIWGAPYTGLYRNYHDAGLKPNKQNIVQPFAKKIQAVFILQKGSINDECKPENYVDLMTLINRYSLGYYYSPCVRVLDYYNRGFDIKEAQSTEEQIVKKIADNTLTYFIERQNSLDFAECIQSLLNE